MTTFSADEIAREYNESAAFADDYKRNRWGSQLSMIHRMNLALQQLPFTNESRWLDIGCGSGVLQSLIAGSFRHIHGTAIDLSSELLKHAQAKKLQNIHFIRQNFTDFRQSPFDIITCLGVLQKTSFELDEFFQHSSDLLAATGQLFVSTKHSGWLQFNEPDFEPCPVHLWFSIKNLEEAVASAPRLKIMKMGGFIPAENRLVEPHDSHDIYMLVEKLSD